MPTVGYPQQKGWGSIQSPGLTQGYADRIHTIIFEPLPRSAYKNL